MPETREERVARNLRLNADRCPNCGRASPPCRCGEIVPARRCPVHTGRNFVVEAIPSYGPKPGQFKWFNVMRCPVTGCPSLARAIKNPTGDRRSNRKTGRKNK